MDSHIHRPLLIFHSFSHSLYYCSLFNIITPYCAQYLETLCLLDYITLTTLKDNESNGTKRTW